MTKIVASNKRDNLEISGNFSKCYLSSANVFGSLNCKQYGLILSDCCLIRVYAVCFHVKCSLACI